MNRDDSIVFPSQPGAAHLHTYFGNTLSNASSTTQTLFNSGNSTCDGGTVNRSSYWVPSLLDTSGNPQRPTHLGVYYKSGYQGPRFSDIHPVLPLGLKLIAGDARATSQSPQDSPASMEWRCGDNSIIESKSIPSCSPGDVVVVALRFPQCWDGVNLDSPDHKSHMAYGRSGGCPTTHPIALPEITYTVVWSVPTSGNTNWRLSSDVYNGPGGHSMHGDIITAWEPAVSSKWLANCVRRDADCGVGRISATEDLIWATP